MPDPVTGPKSTGARTREQELTEFLDKYYAAKKAKQATVPISSEGGQSTLAKIASAGGSQYAGIAQHFTGVDTSKRYPLNAIAGIPNPTGRDLQEASDKKKDEAAAYLATPEGDREATMQRLRDRTSASTDEWSTPENTQRLAQQEMSDPGTFLTGAFRSALGNTGFGKTVLRTADVAGNIFGIEDAIQTPEYRQAKAAATSGGSDFIAENVGGAVRSLAELGLTAEALPALGIVAKAPNLFAAQYAASNRNLLAENPAEFAKGLVLAYTGGKAFEAVPGGNIAGRMAGTGAVMATQDIVGAMASQEQTTPGNVAKSFVTGAAFGALGGGEKPALADEVNINRAIKAIVGQESGGNSNAVSPTGVKGKYQITEKLTEVLTEKYLGVKKTRDEILGTPEEDIVGQSYIRDLYKENLQKSGGDPEQAMHGLALDYYGRGKHEVGPPPLVYARNIVKRFRIATGEPLEGTNINEQLSEPRREDTAAPVEEHQTEAAAPADEQIPPAKTQPTEITDEDTGQTSSEDSGIPSQPVGDVGGEEITAAAPSLTFEDTTRGAQSGQTDNTLIARDETGKRIGHIDYADYDGEASIQNVFVEPEYRRRGVGTALFDELTKQYPYSEIQKGMSTEDGGAFTDYLSDRYKPIETETQHITSESESTSAQEETDPLLNRSPYKNRQLAAEVLQNPQTPEQAALGWIVSGGKIHPDSYTREVMPEQGRRSGELRQAQKNGFVHSGGMTIDAAAHDLWENQPEQLDYSTEDYRNALIDAYRTHGGKTTMYARLAEDHPDVKMAEAMRDQHENDAALHQSIIGEADVAPDAKAFFDDVENLSAEDRNRILPDHLVERYANDNGEIDVDSLKKDFDEAANDDGKGFGINTDLIEHADQIKHFISGSQSKGAETTHQSALPAEEETRQSPFYETQSQVTPAGALRSELIPGLTDAAAEAGKGLTAANKISERIAADRAAIETPEEAEKKIDYAAPPEHENSPIGIANAQIDAMRDKYGLPPRMEAVRNSHPDAYRQAMEQLAGNPNIGHDLVDELAKKPRATDPHENVLLIRERAIRETALEEAANDLNTAKTEWQKTEAKIRHIESLERLRRLADVVDRVGTLAGQSLEARKILLNSDDLSLAQMQRQYQASVKAGEELSPEDLSKVQSHYDEMQKSRKAIDAAGEASANNEASHYVDELVRETERLKAENEKLRNASGEIFDKLRTGEIKPALYGEKLKARGSEILERGRQRLRDIAAGKVPLSASILPIHPELLKAYTEIGVGHLLESTGKFTEWSRKMLADIGDEIRPHLRDIYESAVGAAKQEVFADDQAEPGVTGKRTPAQVLINIRKNQKFSKGDIFVLAREHAEAGVRGLDVLSEVHQQIKSILPETSLRNVRDVFVDYGKTRYPSADDILRELRRVRSLGQLTSKVEDANKGIAPKRSGIQRDKPDPEVRNLMKQLSAALRDNNIEIGNPEKEIASKHQARMTRLNNEIEDIERQLQTGQRPPERKASQDWTPEEKALQTKLDGLRSERDKAFALSEEEMYQKRLDAAKAALKKRESELRQKFQEGDFAKRKKAEPLRPDAELLTAQARFKRLKSAWDQQLQRGEQANQPKWKKTLRMAADIRRAGVLSALTVFEKLGAAATASQFISAPLEEISSSMWKHIPGVSQIAAKAPRWGTGFSMKAEAASVSGFAKGIQDGFRQIVGAVGKESAMDASKPDYTVLYGDKPTLSAGFVQRISATHAAIKEPAKQGEFMRSLVKRLDYAVRNGENVNDPVTYDGIAHQAYQDAARRIWMNDNALSSAWRQAVHSLASSKKSPTMGPVLATLMQLEVPITRVPTNVVGEVFSTVAGVPVGLARAALALAKGVENLPQEKSESIMRQLAKGTPGAAAMLLGLYYHKDIGGFFTQHDKKKKDEPNFGEVKIGDVILPKELFHATLGMQLHLGATIGHALDKQKHGETDLPEAIVTGMIGLSANVPYFQAASNIGRALESGKSATKYVGEELKGWVEPAVVQYVARKLDSDAKGEPIKRKPESWKEIFEEGLPFLRQLVPTQSSKSGNTFRTGSVLISQ